MPVVGADVFVGYLAVLVDDEDGRGCEAVSEEVEDVVADGHVVVLAGVQDGEVWSCFGDDGFGTAEVVGADRQNFGSGTGDFRVVVLELT